MLIEPFRMRKSKIFELKFSVQIYIGKRQYVPAWPMHSRCPIKSIYQWRGMMNNDSLHWLFIIHFVAKVFGPFPVKNSVVDLNMVFFSKFKTGIPNQRKSLLLTLHFMSLYMNLWSFMIIFFCYTYQIPIEFIFQHFYFMETTFNKTTFPSMYLEKITWSLKGCHIHYIHTSSCLFAFRSSFRLYRFDFYGWKYILQLPNMSVKRNMKLFCSHLVNINRVLLKFMCRPENSFHKKWIMFPESYFGIRISMGNISKI